VLTNLLGKYLSYSSLLELAVNRSKTVNLSWATQL